MIAILSGIFGFISSMAPEVLNMIKASSDKKHELIVMEKQAELGLQQAKSEQLKSESEAEARIYEAATRAATAELKLAEKSWIAAYSATVRPTITYGIFLLYTVIKVKLVLYVMGTLSGPALPWTVESAVAIMWTELDASILSFSMCYWFGSRSLQRGKK